MTFFKPNWFLTSIYDLKPADLRKFDIKTILTDLDNTLIAWHEPEASAQLQQWLDLMHTHQIQVIVISNNSKRRVQRAVAGLKIPFIHSAFKPFPRGINQALKRFDLKKEQTVMVGDQLLTDMKAGHLAGLRTILVRPLVETDSWTTKFNRFLERIIMRRYQQKSSLKWQEHLDD